MKSNVKTASTPKLIRELSDRELNEITKAVGDRVRAQTIEQKERMKASLQKELALVRAAFSRHDKKRSKA